MDIHCLRIIVDMDWQWGEKQKNLASLSEMYEFMICKKSVSFFIILYKTEIVSLANISIFIQFHSKLKTA